MKLHNETTCEECKTLGEAAEVVGHVRKHSLGAERERLERLQEGLYGLRYQHLKNTTRTALTKEQITKIAEFIRGESA